MAHKQASDRDWKEWVKYHCKLFGLVLDGDLAAVAAWVDTDLRRCSKEELFESSRELLKNPPTWISKHFSGLWEIIAAKRSRIALKRSGLPQVAKESLECSKCGGSGFRSLPAVPLEIPKNWRWRGEVCSVVCDCSDSARFPRFISFADYVQLVPNWEELVWERQAELAEKSAKAVKDADFEASRQRLIDWFGLKM